MYGLYGLPVSELLNQMCDTGPDENEEAKKRPQSITQCYYCGMKEKYGDGKTRSPLLSYKHIFGCPERNG